MADRLAVTKTYKLYIGGAFVRSESGRSWPVHDSADAVAAHVARASRKDLRDAVEAARAAQSGWAARSAYNRSQILYRMAEMFEGRSDEFVDAIRTPGAAKTPRPTLAAARREVQASIDRLVCFAGWADKFGHVLGCQNAVEGPYYNFTVPEPTGVIAIVPPTDPSLLGLVSLLAPPLCAGNAVLAIVEPDHSIAAVCLGEVCATSDVPGGAVNILTGERDELIDHVAQHREVDAISAAGVGRAMAERLRLGTAENVKRVSIARTRDDAWYDDPRLESPWSIEPFVEMKTIWHPSSC